MIDCARVELRAALRELTGPRGGVNLSIDPVGGSATEAALRSLAWGGRHLVVGFASGSIPAIAANLVLLKGATLLGVNFGGYALRFPDRAAAIYRALVSMLAEPGPAPATAGARRDARRRPCARAHGGSRRAGQDRANQSLSLKRYQWRGRLAPARGAHRREC